MSPTLAAPPPVKKHTPDDLLRLPDRGKRFELVDGEFKELDVSYLSCYVAGRVCIRLSVYVEARNLGWVSPEGASYRCFPDDPDRVRRADTAFHALGRLTPDRATAEGYCTIVPDLVVEVVSQNDLADEVTRKRVEWLAAGARLVWVVFPLQQEVNAFRADGTVALFRRGDTLTGDPVLPDFRVPVADLFLLPAAGPA